MTTLTLPFRSRDRRGVVGVHVEPNVSGAAVGLDVVAPTFDEAAVTGFPILHATVSFEGDGYLGVFGWLQTVTHRYADGSPDHTELDVLPLPGLDTASPLCWLGYLPTFMDAPANPDHPDMDWVAHAWLMQIPDIVRSRRIAPVIGFSWGYRLRDRRPVAILDPIPLGVEPWEADRAVVADRFPDWSTLPWPS